MCILYNIYIYNKYIYIYNKYIINIYIYIIIIQWDLIEVL